MKRKIRLAPYLYILLSTFFLVLFIYYPAIKTMWKSLYVVNAENHPVAFVGFKNYVTLFRDADFINAIKQRFTRGYKRYKETSGLTEWKIGHIFHSIFT